jgi:hypothetical protein
MYDVFDIPTEQVRRALRTLSLAQEKVARVKARKNARMIVQLVAHPSAPPVQIRKAVYLLEQSMKKGDWRWDLVESALTEVCSPWPALAGRRVERGLTTCGKPVGVPDLVRHVRRTHEMVSVLSAEQVGVEQLDAARCRFQRRSACRHYRPSRIDGQWELHDVTLPLTLFLDELATLLAGTAEPMDSAARLRA